MTMFDLSGRKALVTGGSRGLGQGLAEAMLEAGADVVIVGKSRRVFNTAAALSRQSGRAVHPIQADLGDRRQLHDAFHAAVQHLQGLDILIVGHGIITHHAAEAYPIEEWDAVLEVNLSSMFLLNQLAGKHMLAQGHGKIINVASMLTFFGGITVPAYAAAKGGVGQLTKALSNEWAGRGVNVNAIAPGYMATDMTAALLADERRNQMILARIPKGRWGQPDDLKGAAVFLASDASNYVSGVVLPVDGGWCGR